MLPPEPAVLAARQGFADAQVSLTGIVAPQGYYQLSWYGTTISDERGSFGVVAADGPLFQLVGQFAQLTVATRSVNVYIIGGAVNLLTDLAVTRRAYLALSTLADEPLRVLVGTLS